MGSNNEYEQQQFWENKDPWEELGKVMANYIKVAYDTTKYKTLLSFLTENHKADNDIEYKWDINKDYTNGK